MTNLGADPNGNASRNCWMIHKLVGCFVTLKCRMRQAFPFGSAPRFVIFDRDGKYGLEVPAAVRALSVSPVRTSFESPWQNGVADRWVGSCRRDPLPHIIPLYNPHLKHRLPDHIPHSH